LNLNQLLQAHKQRRFISSVNSFNANVLHLRNPLIVAWWSMAFPGFGHFMNNSYIFGFFLMSTEYMVNTLSNINTAIFYSFTGEFEKAKEVIVLRYFFLYVSVYVFAIWDSYQRAVVLNKEFQLAYFQAKSICSFHMSTMEINPLNIKVPWVAAVWAFWLPISGYIYLQRLPAVLFGFIWWLVVLHFSHFLEGLYYSLVGEFNRAKEVLDPQWFLYLPSIIMFPTYNSYQMAVENNNLFVLEQSQFLKSHYQKGDFEELYTFYHKG
jgi:hypothetical protein